MAAPNVGLWCVLALVSMSTSRALFPATEPSRQFKVGGAAGWSQPSPGHADLYDRWASKLRFLVGDTINFEYDDGDSVLVVDKQSYYHCSDASPLESFENGTSVVFELDRPGLFYFISGAPDHCKRGQRLIVDVMGSHAPQSRDTPAASPSAFPGSWPSALPSGGGVALSWSPFAAMVVAVVALAQLF